MTSGNEPTRLEGLAYDPWQDHWPNVRIGSLLTNRLVILPVEARSGFPTGEVSWQISASRVSQDDVVLLTGEIVLPLENWFLTTATAGALHFGGEQYPTVATDDGLDAVLEQYGSWASHVLWDFSRATLLHATASFPFGAELHLPAVTPEPVLVTSVMRRQAESDAGVTESE